MSRVVNTFVALVVAVAYSVAEEDPRVSDVEKTCIGDVCSFTTMFLQTAFQRSVPAEHTQSNSNVGFSSSASDKEIMSSSPAQPWPEHLEKPTCYMKMSSVRAVDGPDFTSYGITNPSFIVRSDLHEVWFVFRRIRVWPGIAKHLTIFWLSDMLFGILPLTLFQDFMGAALTDVKSGNAVEFADLKSAPDPRFQGTNANKRECGGDYFRPGFQAFGPEDPKLFMFNNKTYLTIVAKSLTPLNDTAPCGHTNCEDTDLGTEFHVQLVELLTVHPAVTYGPIVSLYFQGMYRTEKGWSMFSWQPPGGEAQLLALYSVHPHTVMRTNLSSGLMQVVSSDESVLLPRVAAAKGVNVHRIHGGSGVVLIPNRVQPYYLAVLHFHQWSDYEHYPYKFRAEPPFDIMQVGRKLPLIGADGLVRGFHNISYVSSIDLHGGDVVIAYGSGDRTSRLFRMPIDNFEEEFFKDVSW